MDLDIQGYKVIYIFYNLRCYLFVDFRVWV